jgi:hypothetical protein
VHNAVQKTEWEELENILGGIMALDKTEQAVIFIMSDAKLI